MPNEKYKLPDYPCTHDMWDTLASESRPIVIYGMGNGADKLLCKFDEYGIKATDIFASDGFVRGHSFHGYRVKSFSEIKESYSDFVIVLSFASNKEDVISMIEDIDKSYDMYVPDMPIAGVDEFFDKNFYNRHFDEINRAYNLLADEESRCVFASVINYKLTGRLKYLSGTYSSSENLYSIFPRTEIVTAIDAGAYNGDTVREAKCYFPSLKKVYALEPDLRNFKKILKYSEAENEIEVIPINAAAWSVNSVGEFSGSGNRNSTIVATASYENKKSEVELRRIDTLVTERVDYIKYDVEGAEFEALEGSSELIKKYAPSLLVSVYHRSKDIFAIPNMLHRKYPFYKLYLRRLRCIPAWELDLVLVP